MTNMYFNGTSNMKSPMDFNGLIIEVGDTLSWDFHNPDRKESEIEDWMKEEIFVVKEHNSGSGLCAIGINKDLYLHDFRFNHCEIVRKNINRPAPYDFVCELSLHYDEFATKVNGIPGYLTIPTLGGWKIFSDYSWLNEPQNEKHKNVFNLIANEFNVHINF